MTRTDCSEWETLHGVSAQNPAAQSADPPDSSGGVHLLHQVRRPVPSSPSHELPIQQQLHPTTAGPSL